MHLKLGIQKISPFAILRFTRVAYLFKIFLSSNLDIELVLERKDHEFEYLSYSTLYPRLFLATEYFIYSYNLLDNRKL